MFAIKRIHPVDDMHIKLRGDVGFTYIMRRDEPYVAQELAGAFSSRTGIDPWRARAAIHESYSAFHSKLANLLGTHLAAKFGKVEIHLYEPDVLEDLVLAKTKQQPSINLDPLLDGRLPSMSSLGTSRHYALSGVHSLRQGARPECLPVEEQIDGLSQKLRGKPAVVTEDDIFSGKSILEVILALRARGIECSAVFPGIQVGESAALDELRVAVEPIVRYSSSTERDVFDQVDLGDARDFIVGASGLVVLLPDRTLGRAPYVLPFVSPTARVGIPAAEEVAFSHDVLAANFQFFKRIEQLLGTPVLLQDMDRSFAHMCTSLYGLDPTMPMTDVVAWAGHRMDPLYTVNTELGKLQSRFQKLRFPEKTILLDLNGTLIPDDATTPFPVKEIRPKIQNLIRSLSAKGIQVGLCSDSPMQPLIDRIANPLGITGPIIAENGNIVRHDNFACCLRDLPSLHALREKISFIIDNYPAFYRRKDDCSSAEFGGTLPRFDRNEWAFGAGRETSIAIFGPRKLIESLGKDLVLPPTLSMDVSPEYNYLAIHPGNFRLNKGETLQALSAFGYDVTMVGNSMSDWVAPDSGVRCGFVAESRVPEEILQQASYVSELPCADGVADILKKLLVDTRS